ncbi:MAG: hypothetical protein HY763_03295 [Planctomycetes bacterium]|nr:hypothetical protein [Planctomycetota bacterium]
MRDTGGALLSDEPTPVVRTGALDEDGMALPDERARASRGAWQHAIDDYLIEWGRHPEQLADEALDLVAPTPIAIRIASDLAMRARDNAWPPPLRVVPDGEGGIAFELRAGAVFQSLEVSGDGVLELLTFRDSKLVSRDPLPRVG